MRMEFWDGSKTILFTTYGKTEEECQEQGQTLIGIELAYKLHKRIYDEPLVNPGDKEYRRNYTLHNAEMLSEYIKKFGIIQEQESSVPSLAQTDEELAIKLEESYKTSDHVQFMETSAEPTRAIRHDQDKPDMSLLSPIAMFGLARVMTHGLKKYPGSQWKKGMAWSKVTAALLRHLFKFMAGEDFDFDSNCQGCQNNKCANHSALPHVDCIAANAMFLQEYFRKHKDLDDRIKTGLE